jgi:hypothetical protein
VTQVDGCWNPTRGDGAFIVRISGVKRDNSFTLALPSSQASQPAIDAPVLRMAKSVSCNEPVDGGALPAQCGSVSVTDDLSTLLVRDAACFKADSLVTIQCPSGTETLPVLEVNVADVTASLAGMRADQIFTGDDHLAEAIGATVWKREPAYDHAYGLITDELIDRATVKQLQAELRSRHVSSTGRKEVLKAKLKRAVQPGEVAGGIFTYDPVVSVLFDVVGRMDSTRLCSSCPA